MHNSGEKVPFFHLTVESMSHVVSQTNPGPLEAILNQDPHVNASVMFGRGKFNAGVLVDPKPQYRFDPADTEKLSQFRNLIW